MRLLLVIAAAGVVQALLAVGSTTALLIRNLRDPEMQEMGVGWRQLLPVEPVVAFSVAGVLCLGLVAVLLALGTRLPSAPTTVIVGVLSLLTWPAVIAGAVFLLRTVVPGGEV